MIHNQFSFAGNAELFMDEHGIDSDDVWFESSSFVPFVLGEIISIEIAHHFIKFKVIEIHKGLYSTNNKLANQCDLGITYTMDIANIAHEEKKLSK